MSGERKCQKLEIGKAASVRRKNRHRDAAVLYSVTRVYRDSNEVPSHAGVSSIRGVEIKP